MKVNLKDFRNKISKLVPAVGSKEVRITVAENSTDMVVAAIRNSFSISRTIHDVVDAEVINVEADASLLRSMVALFIDINDGEKKDGKGDDTMLEIVKQGNTIVLRTLGNELTVPISDLGDAGFIDEKNDGVEYVNEMKIKFISYYINETAHALEKAAMTGGDIRKASYCLEIDKELRHLRVTATDGFRISMRAGAIEDIEYTFVVPGVEMKAAISMLENDDEAVFRIPKEGQFLQMAGKDMVAVLPLVNASFFGGSVSSIIKEIDANSLIRCTANKNMIINACDMVQLLDPKIVFDFRKGNLVLGTTHPNGFIKKDIPVRYSQGDRVSKKIAFDAKFMADALKSIRTQKVDIMMESKNGTCKITPHVEEGSRPKKGKSIEVVLPRKIVD